MNLGLHLRVWFLIWKALTLGQTAGCSCGNCLLLLVCFCSTGRLRQVLRWHFWALGLDSWGMPYMWVLRKFPTGKSLNCIKGLLSVSLKGQHETTTSLRNVFGKTEKKGKKQHLNRLGAYLQNQGRGLLSPSGPFEFFLKCYPSMHSVQWKPSIIPQLQ